MAIQRLYVFIYALSLLLGFSFAFLLHFTFIGAIWCEYFSRWLANAYPDIYWGILEWEFGMDVRDICYVGN